ncbi:NipSnap protein K02D10.1 [Aphelenchoides fujianensis]|nr:NipSnap protein K02D10.1 [Aphelenchoides fujianensis]
MPVPLEITRSELFAAYDTVLFDADGVLWLGDVVVPGAVEAIDQLMRAGKQVLMITNNSTKTAAQFASKLEKLGFSSINGTNVVSSGFVAMEALGGNPRKDELPVYLIGTRELAEMLQSVGVRSIGVGPDHLENYVQDGFLMDVPLEQRVFAVVTSFDSHFNYVKLMKAANYLKDPTVEFYSTNDDLTYPGSVPGVVVPGAGSSAVPVRAVSGRESTIFGKPHSAMFEYIRRRFKIDPKRTLMVGDRLDTDILFGNRNRIDTLLVLTGIHSLADVQQAEAATRLGEVPRFYAPSVRVFVE